MIAHECLSGRHWWRDRESADKCCNGYRRILLVGYADIRAAGVPIDGVEAGTPYGYTWILEQEEVGV